MQKSILFCALALFLVSIISGCGDKKKSDSSNQPLNDQDAAITDADTLLNDPDNFISSDADLDDNNIVPVVDSEPDLDIDSAEDDASVNMDDDVIQNDADAVVNLPDNDKPSECSVAEYKISGTVTNKVGGKIIKGIEVSYYETGSSASDKKIFSKEDGSFSVKLLTSSCKKPDGKISLKFRDIDSSANNGAFVAVVLDETLTKTNNSSENAPDGVYEKKDVSVTMMPTDGVGAPDKGCLALHCAGTAAKCALDKECKAALDCTSNCPTENPEENQRCNIVCLGSNANPKFDEVSKCIVENKCFSEPQSECPVPSNAVKLSEITLPDLDGAWWVVRGLSRAYDCWSCQKMSFSSIDENTSKYDYDYIVTPPNGSYISCDVKMAEPYKAGHMTVSYNAHGMPGGDDWYFLSRPSDDQMLIYYCGSTPIAKYRGAVVISRTPDINLPDDVAAKINQALIDADIATPVKLDDMCAPDNSFCIE